jgi:hypothetical protein
MLSRNWQIIDKIERLEQPELKDILARLEQIQQIGRMIYRYDQNMNKLVQTELQANLTNSIRSIRNAAICIHIPMVAGATRRIVNIVVDRKIPIRLHLNLLMN